MGDARPAASTPDGGRTTALIDGKKVAAELHERIGRRCADLKRDHDLVPGLAVVLVGDDPASRLYVESKAKQAAAVGIRAFDHRLPFTATTAELRRLIEQLNSQPEVHGILVQLPLPAQIDATEILWSLDPRKDVDGFHPINAGRLACGMDGVVPCTPLGCLLLIRSVQPQLAGQRALVIGRSNIVGKPMAQLLLREHCTVTIAHSRTRDLAAECGMADIVVAAIGRPRAIAGAWIRPGAIVVDVGINRVTDATGKSRVVGDVDFEGALGRARAITPVPGGAGPMTIACLLLNTLNAAIRAGSLDPKLVLTP